MNRYHNSLDRIKRDLIVAAIKEHGGFGAGMIGDLLGFLQAAAIVPKAVMPVA